MPQHALKGSNAFKFDLAAPTGWSYAPGDTIIGNLMRKMPIVTPEATVSLSLAGRSKVKIVHSSNQERHEYRDNWQIFPGKESLIYKGPMHLPEGSDEVLNWPISLDIPLEPVQSSVRRYDPEFSFLPADMDHPLHHTLPGSFFSTGGSTFGSYSSLDFVEYFLTAQLRYQHAGHFEKIEAVCPIILRHSAPKIDRLGVPQVLREPRRVSSQRLLPGMEEAELSFKQHAQKFFGSSKVPNFFYNLCFTVPACIQLGDPTPMPIQIEIAQDPAKTSDCIKDVAQHIQISEIGADLISETHDRANGSGIFSNIEKNSYERKFHLNIQQVLDQLESPLIITTGKGNEPIHIGNMFQLTMDSKGIRTGNRIIYSSSYGALIYPDLMTHNIKHTHSMRWKVCLNIAGETETHRFWHKVQIIESA